MEIPGIDVSKHNGTIDWQKVKASGIKFAIIRLGWAGYDGRIRDNGGLDPLFYTNINGALAAGLDVGVYLYSYCQTAAAARVAAKETLALIEGYTLTYPVAFDIEDAMYCNVSQKSTNTAISEAFLGALEEAGFLGILYTYKSFALSFLDMAALSRYDFWLAHYTAKTDYAGPYGIWQHHGDKQLNHPAGSCPGVTGACDLNTAYKDYPALIRAAGLNGFTVEPEPDTGELDALRREVVQLEHDLAVAQDKFDDLLADLRALVDRWK